MEIQQKQTIMALLDENKDSIPEGLYLNLCNALAKEVKYDESKEYIVNLKVVTLRPEEVECTCDCDDEPSILIDQKIRSRNETIVTKGEYLNFISSRIREFGFCRHENHAYRGNLWATDFYSKIISVEERNRPERKVKEEAIHEEVKDIGFSFELRPGFKLTKLSSGDWEHTETGLIFHRVDTFVYSRRRQDGKITRITKPDIKLCKALKFKYKK